jgi:LEA14-like dessication related protein
MDNQPVIVLIILIVAVIFANMIVIQSVKKRQTEELKSMCRKEPITSTSIIFTTKIKKFALMHKQNQ